MKNSTNYSLDLFGAILTNTVAKVAPTTPTPTPTPKKKLKRISESRLMDALEADDNLGFCLACGAEADGCEPDARKYECESCGEHQVYGAEEVLMMQGC
jgi:hypothetical protein